MGGSPERGGTRECVQHWHGEGCDRWKLLGIFLVFTTLTWGIPILAEGSGFRILPQSASAAGQGNAFAAQSDDPSAIFYNPAGLTQLKGVQLMGGSFLVGGSTEFTSQATGEKSVGDLGGTVSMPPPTHVYLTANLKEFAKDRNLPLLDRFALGIGAFSSFGLKYEWPENGPLNTALTRASLELIDIRPVIAYQLTESLSVAAGADIYTFSGLFGEGQLEVQFRSSGAPGLPPAGTPIEINGKDTEAGFNLSLRYTPCLSTGTKPWCSFGFKYRSRTTLHLDGEFLAGGMSVSDATVRLVIPQTFTFGIAVWPILDRRHEWKLEVDLDKVDWSAFTNTNVRLGDGSVVQVPRNWDDTLTVMVGTEYKRVGPALLPEWILALRAGWLYSESPVPSETFDPAIPDANNHTITAGIGFLCKGSGRFAGVIPCGGSGAWYLPSGIGLDLAYQVALFETRRITDSMPPLTSPSVINGTYRSTTHQGLITFRVNF